MTPTFTTSTDDRIVGLIRAARKRLVIVGPALSQAIATAVVARMADLPELSLTVILDADPEVYRMGYGEVAALEVLRQAAAGASFRLREQPGVRIGLVVSDDQTLVYAPVSASIEAGSTSDEKPNAILLGAAVAELLVEKTLGKPAEGRSPEIGIERLMPERVEAMEEDLRKAPPLPVDLTRQLRVVASHVQYVEMKITGWHISRRRVQLPPEFTGYTSEDLQRRVSGQIGLPMESGKAVSVKLTLDGKEQTLQVDEKYLDGERRFIEKRLAPSLPGRGRIILRRDRAALEAQIERLRLIMAAWEKARAEQHEAARAAFIKGFEDEFLPRWQANPPREYLLRPMTDAERLDVMKEHIKETADSLFDDMIEVDPPKFQVIYKGIALEDISDAGFVATLREVMKKAGVPKKELDRLFETGSAVPEKGAFR